MDEISEFGWLGAGFSAFFQSSIDPEYLPPLDDPWPKANGWMASRWRMRNVPMKRRWNPFSMETGGESMEDALRRLLLNDPQLTSTLLGLSIGHA